MNYEQGAALRHELLKYRKFTTNPDGTKGLLTDISVMSAYKGTKPSSGDMKKML